MMSEPDDEVSFNATDAICIKTEPNTITTDTFSIPEGQRLDASDSNCIKTEPNTIPMDTSSIPAGQSDEKERQSRKRIRHQLRKQKRKQSKRCKTEDNNLLPWLKFPFEETKKPECSVSVSAKSRDVETNDIAESVKQDCCGPDDEDLSNGKNSESNEFFDKMIESIKLSCILKLPLHPPNTLQSNSKTDEFPCTISIYEWENKVSNKTIDAMDRCIKQAVDSVLVSESRYKSYVNEVLYDLNHRIKFEGFTNKWNLLGSYLYGLVRPDSVVQFYFECVPKKENSKPGEVPKCVPKNEKSKLGKVRPEDMFEKTLALLNDISCKNLEFSKVRSSSNLRSAWIKVWSKQIDTDIEIEFSTEFNSGEMLLSKSLLTKMYLDMSPNLKYLTVFLKIILQKEAFRVNCAKLTTYTIFWLVVFFMQLKKLLPAVIDVREAAKEKRFVAGWDCSLPESYSYPTEPISLYSLLLELLDFYKKFDFLNYVICPYLGCVFRLCDFERLQIPKEEFSSYLRQLNRPRQLTFVRNLINLQDPSDLCCNIAEGVEPETVCGFKSVCHRLNELLPDSIEEMETMGCFCSILTYSRNDFNDYYIPCNLTQYADLVLHTESFNLGSSREKKLNQIYILEAIRKIMEAIFNFEKKSIVIRPNVTHVISKEDEDGDTTIVNQTFPVIYFEYCSSESTWENDYIKQIVPRKEDEEGKIKIFLTCEVCLEKRFVKMFVQCESNFVTFLRKDFPKLFEFTLDEIIV